MTKANSWSNLWAYTEIFSRPFERYVILAYQMISLSSQLGPMTFPRHRSFPWFIVPDMSSLLWRGPVNQKKWVTPITIVLLLHKLARPSQYIESAVQYAGFMINQHCQRQLSPSACLTSPQKHLGREKSLNQSQPEFSCPETDTQCPINSVLPSSSGMQPAAGGTAFMVWGALEISTASNTQGSTLPWHPITLQPREYFNFLKAWCLYLKFLTVISYGLPHLSQSARHSKVNVL